MKGRINDDPQTSQIRRALVSRRDAPVHSRRDLSRTQRKGDIKMATKVYLMMAEHFTAPGIVIKICATRDKAVAEGSKTQANRS
jgi:hypothetical protein